MAPEEKQEKKGRSGPSAFLGMVLSGLLSIFIASTMFMVGVVHNRMNEAKERKAVVRFLAVETTDIYGETCRYAHGVFLGNRHSEAVAPKMAGARTLGQAMSLDADPALVAAVRSIHGRYARVQRDVSAAYSFFQKKGKLTQNQIRKVIADCKGMGEEVREVLKIAAAEGIDGKAISRLEGICARADELTDAMVEKQEKLLPDVKLSRTAITLGEWSGSKTIRFQVANFADRPVTITGMACSLEGVRFKAAIRYDDAPVGKEIKPDTSLEYIVMFPKPTLPDGPFEGMFTVETDFPGYEKLAFSIKGTVKKQ